MTETRLRWTPDERQRLADAALPLLVANKKMVIVEAVRQVQDTVLPSERRRNLPNIGSVPVELRADLEQRRKAATGEAKTVPAEQYELLVANNRELTEANATLSATVTSLREEIARLEMRPAPPDPFEIVKEFCADILRRAGRSDGSELAAPVAAAAPSGGNGQQHHRHDPLPRDDSSERPPSILVCGLQSDQRAFFESTFHKRARLRFHSTEGRGAIKGGDKELREKARHMDMVFVMLESVSQADMAMITESGATYQRVKGRQALRDHIENYLQRRPTQ